MILSKDEFIGALQNEIRVLLHLCGKIDPAKLDYRPTEKQRSTLELLRYLNVMGPNLVKAAKTGTFDTEAWGASVAASEKLGLEELVSSISSQSDLYAKELGSMSDDDFRTEVEMFGQKQTRVQFLTYMLLCGHAAYRMQLFMNLKASGRPELNTMNLWGGVDGAM